jgi:hypothetical protein
MARRASPRNANEISAQLGWRDVARPRWFARAAGRLGCALSTFDLVLGACAIRTLLSHWHPSPTAAGVLFAVALITGRVRGRGAAHQPGNVRRSLIADPEALARRAGRRATRRRGFIRSRQRR